MKKLLVIILVVATVLCAFVSCGKKAATTATTTSTAAKATTAAATKTETVVQKGLSTEELLALAKQEKGEFIVYGNTSRVASAVEGFVKKYGTELGLTTSTATGTKMNDADIYTTLLQEAVGSSAKVASVVMIQDGAQLMTYKAGTDILINYVPESMKSVVSEADQNPLVHQYINKLFIWNNIGQSEQVLTNVWQLTEPQWKNKVFFKNPTTEQVNMNFLVMCTSDDWSARIARAYLDYYGKDIELGSYKNAGYKWVAEFIANCNFSISSDTTIAKTMAKADSEGCIGLFVLSKFRDIDASIKGNLSVGSWQATEIEPFSGFMYPMYIQMTAKSNRPNTAKLFIDYLMSAEGFSPWGKDIGAYSTDPSIPVNTADGDQPITFWKDTLVAEDAEFIRLNKTAVLDFVTAEIAKKK